MKQRFTHLIAKAVNARFGKAYFTSCLLLLFLMMGNVVWGQTISSISPQCRVAGGGSFTLTVTGTDFNGSSEIVINGTQIPSSRNGNTLTATVAASYTANIGVLEIRSSRSNSPSPTFIPLIVIGAPTVANSTVSRCGPGTVTLTASGAPEGAAYSWYTSATGGTAISGATSSTFSPSVTGNTSYWVSMTAPGGCESARTRIDVVINPIPTAPTTTSNSRCGAGTVELSASGAPTGGSYRWYTTSSGGTAIPNQTTASYTTPSLTSTTTYYVSAVSPAGCESSSRIAVTATINPIPAAATGATADPAVFCGSGSSTVSATPGANGNIIRWYSASTGGTLLETNNSYATNNLTATTTFYAASFNTTTGCESATRTPVTVTVNPLPAAPTNVAASPASVCGSGSVTLSATAPSGATVRWYTVPTGGTSFASGASVNRTVTTSTTFYAASYNTTTGCESAARTAVTVTVNPIPDRPTVPAPDPICGPGTVTITATPGENGTTARWYDAPSGGNLLATANTYSPSVTDNTTFYVSSYNASTTCESNRVAVVVRVNPVPAVPTTTGDEICDGGEVTLRATTGANGNELRWYTAPSGGTSFNSSTIYTTTVTATTTYYVSSYNSTTDCESARVPVTATVIETPVATVIPEGPLAICSGSSTVLAADAAPPGAVYTYQWSNEDGILEDETDQTLTVSEAGTYSVVITSGGLCPSEPSNGVTVTITPLPAAPVADDASRCGPGSVILSASGAPEGGTYRWYTTATGGAPVATGETFETPELQLSRLYYVAAVGAGNGCESARTQVEVIINPLPEASIASETPRCPDPSGVTAFLLNGTVENGTFLDWEIVGGTATAEIIENTENDFTPQVNVTGSGTVQVQLTVTSDNGCGSATDVIELEVYPAPPTVVVDVEPVERCGPGEVTLVISNPSSFSYNWYNAANELVFTGTSFTTTISQTTSYFIAVAGTGNCENADRTEVAAIVNPIPGEPTNVAASATAVCGTADVTLSATIGANGNIVRWYDVATGGTPVATGTSYSPTVSTTTTFYATTYNTTTQCESGRVPVTVTVNPIPGVPTVAAPAPRCGSGTVDLVATLGANATTARWYDAATDGTILATGTTYSPNVSAPTTFYVTSYNANTNCESARVPVDVEVNPIPAAPTNVTANPVALCGSGTVTLSAATGTNGTTVRWYSASTGGVLLETGTSVSRTVSANTTFYAASYNSNTGCESTARVPVSVTVGSPIVNNTLTQPTGAICAGSQAPTINGTLATGGNGAIVYSWESSTTSATAGFTAIPNTNVRNYSPGALSQTTWFRRVASTTGSGCTNTSTAVQVTVTPITTYTLVLTANPFPVCPGQNTTYRATVLANVTSVNYPANPRYEQITWVGGTDVSDQFTFDWWKNDINDRANGQVGREISLSGLSSTDFYTARATPIAGANLGCAEFVNRPELVPGNPGTAALFSNRIYLGRPDDYSVSISREPTGSICPGTSVTFTATPNAEYVNLTMEWVVTNSAGTVVSTTPFNASRTFTSSTLNNGDVVSLNFTSDENRCSPVASSNALTMVVVVPQTMAGGGAYCSGGAGVPVSINSSQVGVSYQLLRTVGSTTENVGAAIAGTGSAVSFGNQTIAGTYTVQPISDNGACTPAYGPVDVYSTPAPAVYAVTGGGDYCASGSGVPVTLANSQTGVNYQLFRSVDGGAPTAVGAAVPGTGSGISFGNQTIAGTYTVIGTSVANATTAACPQAMQGSVDVVVNPLPTVAVAYEQVCEGSPTTVSADVTGGAGGYSYAWTVPAGATNPGNTASFTTSVAGNYAVTVTDAESCSSVTQSSAVAFTELQEFENPFLDVVFNETGTQWEVTATESEVGEGAFGADPTFVWYRRINDATTSEGEWDELVQTGPSNVYIEENPGSDVQIKVEVLNSESCTLYILTNIGVTPLPVEIIYFNAAKQGNNVLLEWATASEERNTGFEVQVSQDGFNFRKLDFVATKNGNTSQKQVYQYTDKENGKRGTRYYRLKQVDTDGTFEYFTTKAVTFTEVASKVKAFPNPFSNKLTLDIAAESSGEVQVNMSNAIGKQLMERTIKVEEGFNTINLEVSTELPHGVYFLRVYLDGKVHQLKLLKE